MVPRRRIAQSAAILISVSFLGLLFAPSHWHLLSLASGAAGVAVLMRLALHPPKTEAHRPHKAKEFKPATLIAPKHDTEVVDSLRALGYTKHEANAVAPTSAAGLPFEDRLRSALQQLARA